MGEGALRKRAGAQGAEPPARQNIEQVADGTAGRSSSQFCFPEISGGSQLTLDGRCEPPLELVPVPEPPEDLASPDELERHGQGVLGDAQCELPNYVQVCQSRRQTGRGGWTLELVHKTTGEQLRIPHECGSWRCEGKCRDRYRHVEWSRIMEALEGIDPRHVYFGVLTLHGDHHRAGILPSYARLSSVWPKLRKRLQRSFPGARYIVTIEEHGSGIPHANVILVSDSRELAELEDNGKLLAEWQRMVVASGWGYMTTIERARDVSAVASYVAKCAVGVSRIAGETAKETQLPHHAPKGTRRLRASRGFLPPRRSSGEWTGRLIFEAAEAVELFDRLDGGKTGAIATYETIARLCTALLRPASHGRATIRPPFSGVGPRSKRGMGDPRAHTRGPPNRHSSVRPSVSDGGRLPFPGGRGPDCPRPAS